MNVNPLLSAKFYTSLQILKDGVESSTNTAPHRDADHQSLSQIPFSLSLFWFHSRNVVIFRKCYSKFAVATAASAAIVVILRTNTNAHIHTCCRRHSAAQIHVHLQRQEYQLRKSPTHSVHSVELRVFRQTEPFWTVRILVLCVRFLNFLCTCYFAEECAST